MDTRHCEPTAKCSLRNPISNHWANPHCCHLFSHTLHIPSALHHSSDWIHHPPSAERHDCSIRHTLVGCTPRYACPIPGPGRTLPGYFLDPKIPTSGLCVRELTVFSGDRSPRPRPRRRRWNMLVAALSRVTAAPRQPLPATSGCYTCTCTDRWRYQSAGQCRRGHPRHTDCGRGRPSVMACPGRQDWDWARSCAHCLAEPPARAGQQGQVHHNWCERRQPVVVVRQSAFCERRRRSHPCAAPPFPASQTRQQCLHQRPPQHRDPTTPLFPACPQETSPTSIPIRAAPTTAPTVDPGASGPDGSK